MNRETFEAAKRYALDRLQRDLPTGLYYHGLSHTRSDVVPAAETLAGRSGVEGEPLFALLTAVWFHDLGFVEVRAGHEAVGARIAAEVLPGFGFSDPEVDTIQRIILATVIPQSPVTLLEQIMADADLDVLGRDDFLERNTNLRRELAFFGQEFTDVQWLTGQLKFVGGHSYFTPAARELRDAGQAKNVADLELMLERARATAHG